MTTSQRQNKLIDPHEAMSQLLDVLRAVQTERVPIDDAADRVLAETIVTDRPSPACNVSSMDGYAVREADMSRAWLAVAGQVQAGDAPSVLQPGAAMRIFTGAAVPHGAELVIKREDVQELPDRIVLPENLQVRRGMFIRYRGENGEAGEAIATPGSIVTPATIAAAASCGYRQLRVHRPVRVTVLSTGNELANDDATIEPWQIRDANGPAIAAMLGRVPWIEVQPVRHIADDLPMLATQVREALAGADVLISTGGVSMGDYDLMPDAIAQAGGRIVFHRVALRPGKPLLGAVGPNGQAIVALPGNPVSAMVTLRRFGMAAIRRVGGCASCLPRPRLVRWHDDGERLPLWWYRLAKCDGEDRVTLMDNRGSGDWVALGHSDGVIEVPPVHVNADGGAAERLGHFYAWQEG